MSTLKIGLLGGSFDPIHKGHLELAKAILKDGCQEVWFLPCQASPLKERSLSSFEHRTNMIEWAIAPFKKMKVCTIERDLPVPSYTVTTLRELKRKYQADFIFYIGNDQAKQLDKWKDIDDCMKLAEFRVFKRDSNDVECAYDLKCVEFKQIDISSTKVRQGAFYDVPKSVRRYIWENRLYVDEFVRNQVDEKRYNHSVSVAGVCRELAFVHHLNDDDAYLIGMLHDVCKKWAYEKSEAWMKCFESENIHEPKAIWHGYLVDHYLRRLFNVREKHILNAVHHHVKGDSHNPYAQIVYIADKCEPLRGYDASVELNLARVNLKEAVDYIMKIQKAYIAKENKKHE